MRLAVIGGFIPHQGVRIGVRVARGQVSSKGQGDLRGLAGLNERETLQPGHGVARDDGDDRQQQGLQLLQGHGRPPAIKRDELG
jgi:hypothetical protein